MLFAPFAIALQTLIGASYQFPPPLSVAPGQVIPVLATGLHTILPGRMQAQSVPLPRNLAGISVTLQQTLPDRTWSLPIFAVEQRNNCGSVSITADCVQTAVTVQIPYDITVPNPYIATLVAQSYSTITMTENGATSTSFVVQPVYDRVHVLRSCDINGLTENTGVCYPLVAHTDGTLVLQDVRVSGVAQTHSEAVPGETLVMYAYGMGRVSTSVPPGVPSPVPAAVATEPFYLRFDYSPNAAPSLPPIPPLPSEDQPEFVGLTPGQIGLYQINVVVPQPPPGTAPCGAAQSNLTIGILGLGSGSFDGAAICVDPGASAP